MIRFRDSKAVHRKNTTTEPAPQLNNSTAREHRHSFCRQPLDKGLITSRHEIQCSNLDNANNRTPAQVDRPRHWTKVQWRSTVRRRNLIVKDQCSVDQLTENLVYRPSQIDRVLSAANESAESDSSISRRHALRFADDKTDELGVDAVNSCRIRSPILFRWNIAHERARLT